MEVNIMIKIHFVDPYICLFTVCNRVIKKKFISFLVHMNPADGLNRKLRFNTKLIWS